MSDLAVRALQTEDALAYKHARLLALKTEPTAFTSAFETARLQPEEFFHERASFKEDNFLYGVFDPEQDPELSLIGMAGGFVEKEQKRKHIGKIVSVWVHDDYRRQGYARKLTEAVMNQLKALQGVTTLQLSVTHSNAGAKSLYQSLGFEQWGLEPRALAHDNRYHDEIHMGLLLD